MMISGKSCKNIAKASEQTSFLCIYYIWASRYSGKKATGCPQLRRFDDKLLEIKVALC